MICRTLDRNRRRKRDSGSGNHTHSVKINKRIIIPVFYKAVPPPVEPSLVLFIFEWACQSNFTQPEGKHEDNLGMVVTKLIVNADNSTMQHGVTIVVYCDDFASLGHLLSRMDHGMNLPHVYNYKIILLRTKPQVKVSK